MKKKSKTDEAAIAHYIKTFRTVSGGSEHIKCVFKTSPWLMNHATPFSLLPFFSHCLIPTYGKLWVSTFCLALLSIQKLFSRSELLINIAYIYTISNIFILKLSLLISAWLVDAVAEHPAAAEGVTGCKKSWELLLLFYLFVSCPYYLPLPVSPTSTTLCNESGWERVTSPSHPVNQLWLSWSRWDHH